MIESIRQEFLQILKDSDWMDKESKDLALAKVYNILIWKIFFSKIKLNFSLKRPITLIQKLASLNLFITTLT